MNRKVFVSRKSLIFIFCWAVSFLLASCRQEIKHSEKFRKIISSDEGIFRGIEFGTSVAQVREKEKSEPLYDDALSVSYDILLGENEKAVIHYDKDSSGVSVEYFRSKIILKDDVSAKDLYKELHDYYNVKLGTSKSNVEFKEYWKAETNPSYLVELTLPQGETNIYLQIHRE